MSYLNIFVPVLTFFILFQDGSPATQNLCDVTNKEGPQKNKQCVLPFKLKGVPYKECTNKNDPDGKFWCSTSVDKDTGEHVGGKGQWGFCHEECNFGNTNFKNSAKRTSVTPRKTVTPKTRKQNKDQNAFDFTLSQEDLIENLTEYMTEPPITSTRIPITPKPTLVTEYTLDPSISTAKFEKSVASSHSPRPTTKRTQKPIDTTKPSKISSHVNDNYDDQNYDIYGNDGYDDYEEGFDDYDYKPLGLQTDSSDGTWLPTFGQDTCGEETDAGYIVGGTKAKGGEFPFMAALGRLNKDNTIFFICGGTLINRRYVLTAAHCHSVKPGSNLHLSKVVLGASDLSRLNDFETFGSRPKIFDIGPSDVIQHEDFKPANPEAGSDIALIRLPRAVNTALEDPKENILPICLQWNDNIEMPNPLYRLSLILGWGKDNNLSFDKGDLSSCGAYSCELKKAYVPIVPFADCRRSHRLSFQIHRNQHICAGDEGRDTCSGDSGGPLLVKSDKHSPTWLLGIVSFGVKKCGTGVPGVYTNLQQFMPWITSKLKP